MNHYVCTGSCKGEARSAGVCEAEFCSKESQDLVPCDCSDSLHTDAGNAPGPEKSDSK